MKEGEKKKENIIQCLFDFKIFFKKKGHLYFPGKMCFPQYFAFTMASICNNLYTTENINVIHLCYGFFNILPVIVKQLFGSDIIIVKERLEKLANKVRDNRHKKKIEIDDDYILLETYLANKHCIMNYRKALLECTLTYHQLNNLTELIRHLYDVKCCKTKEEDEGSIMNDYPSSDHYLLFLPSMRSNNLHVVNVVGTRLWGPFYWNIFHSVAAAFPYDNDEEEAQLIDFVYVLPFTIPCDLCRFNYVQNILFFEDLIQEYRMSHKCLKSLYEKIHDKVNYDTS